MEHRQYNLPTQPYLANAAEEQYRIHPGQVFNSQNTQQSTIPFDYGQQQFSPSKSQTIRIIQDEDYNNIQEPQYLENQFYNSVSISQHPQAQQQSQYQIEQQKFQQQQFQQQQLQQQRLQQQRLQQQQLQQQRLQQQRLQQQQLQQQLQQQQFQQQQLQQQQLQQQQFQQQQFQLNQGQNWAGDVYERSEHARSQSPSYRYYYSNNDNVRIPSGAAPQFTTDTPAGLVQVRYNSLPRARRDDTHHNPVESGASEKGYLFGGMDFNDHSQDHLLYSVHDDYNDWYERRSRRDQESVKKPGHNFGVEYNESPTRNFTYDENYRGYSASHPVKHWHYAADPCLPVNSYVSDAVECVDPVRLVGDTISNQKVQIERFLTEEEKNNPGTAFAEPMGFKPDHRTVKPEPKESETICYSLSAKKHLARTNDCHTSSRSQSAGPRSNCAPQQNSFQYNNHNSASYNNQSGAQYSSQDIAQYRSNNAQLNTNSQVPVNAQQLRQGKKEVTLLTLLDDSAIQRQPNVIKSPEWAEQAHKLRNNVRTDRPAFWNKNTAQAQNTQQFSHTQSQQQFYQPQQQQSQLSKHSSHQSQQPLNVNNQTEQSKQTQNLPQQTRQTSQSQTCQQNFGQRQPHQNTQPQQPYPSIQLQQQSVNQSSQQTQRTYNYTQSKAVPSQSPSGHVYEQNTYVRHGSQPGDQSQAPQQRLQQQQSRIENKPASFSSNQQQPRVEQFSRYPQEQEPGDFQRPGFNQQKQQQQLKIPPQQIKNSPPVVPPKPQLNVQHQVKFDEQNNVVRSPASNKQNSSHYYYKETIQENNQEPQVVEYSSDKPGNFNRFVNMSEGLAPGKLSNTFIESHRGYPQPNGQNVEYNYQLITSTDPDYDGELLKKQQFRIVDNGLQPDSTSRSVTTKYYEKKMVTDNNVSSF